MHQKDPPLESVHRFYEELCALVAGQEASEAQTVQLQEHLEKCPDCRDLLRDLKRYLADPLAQVTVPSGMTDAFLDRLRSNKLTHDLTKPSRIRLRMALCLAALICIAGFISIVRFVQSRRNSNSHAAVREIAATSSAESQATALASPHNDSLLHENADLGRKLREARVEVSNLEAQIKDGQKRLQAAEEEDLRLSSDAATAKEELQALKAAGDQRIGQLEGDLRRVQAERDAYRDSAQSHENEAKDLRTRLLAQDAKVEQQERLIATGNLTWELLVGRNTHRMEVYNTDSDGQTSSGRIYYAEGKKLVFIAYDLTDIRQLAGDVSFYVWGEKLGDKRPVARLGIFRVENEKDRRWILTYDDARVLGQINSVFVTIEPNRVAVTSPHGRRMLSARLDKQSHP